MIKRSLLACRYKTDYVLCHARKKKKKMYLCVHFFDNFTMYRNFLAKDIITNPV